MVLLLLGWTVTSVLEESLSPQWSLTHCSPSSGQAKPQTPALMIAGATSATVPITLPIAFPTCGPVSVKVATTPALALIAPLMTSDSIKAFLVSMAVSTRGKTVAFLVSTMVFSKAAVP
eukprot:03837.XXX_183979_184335_1 [CDS] Oithona nana genome sequencing.